MNGLSFQVSKATDHITSQIYFFNIICLTLHFIYNFISFSIEILSIVSSHLKQNLQNILLYPWNITFTRIIGNDNDIFETRNNNLAGKKSFVCK